MTLVLILGILLFRGSFAFGQNDPINLVPAIPSSQLPEIDINSIAQDSAGFIWIGTWKGLFRYDGRNVINYSQQLNTKIGRKVSSLNLDKEGRLWIGTYSEGLFVYNPKNQQVISYQSINNTKTGNIINISGGTDNNVFVASYDGVFVYDISKAAFDPQTLVYAEAGNSYRLTMSFQDSKGNLWIGSDKGLLRYNRLKKRIENTYCLKDTYIHQILELSNGWLAVSSLRGTDLFDVINGAVVPMNNTPLSAILSAERGESYTSMQLKSGPGLFWIALQNGLMITDIKTSTLVSRPLIIAGKELKTVRVESLFEDRQGIIWVGTNTGLYKYDSNHKPFNMSLIGEANPGIISIAKSGKDLFWVGTSGKGVFQVEVGRNGQPTMQRKLIIPGSGTSSPLNNDIYSIEGGLDGEVWMSTKGSGIVHVKSYRKGPREVTATSVEYFNEANSLADDHVMTLYRDNKGILLGGCWSNGLIYYSAETKMFGRFKGSLARNLKKYPIVKIIEYGPNRYYLGTRGDGMIEIETNSARDSIVKMNKFLNKPGDSTSISNNFIPDFAIMSGNNLWIATENGISILKALTTNS